MNHTLHQSILGKSTINFPWLLRAHGCLSGLGHMSFIAAPPAWKSGSLSLSLSPPFGARERGHGFWCLKTSSMVLCCYFDLFWPRFNRLELTYTLTSLYCNLFVEQKAKMLGHPPANKSLAGFETIASGFCSNQPSELLVETAMLATVLLLCPNWHWTM